MIKGLQIKSKKALVVSYLTYFLYNLYKWENLSWVKKYWYWKVCSYKILCFVVCKIVSVNVGSTKRIHANFLPSQINAYLFYPSSGFLLDVLQLPGNVW